jgi:hypothetical protein
LAAFVTVLAACNGNIGTSTPPMSNAAPRQPPVVQQVNVALPPAHPTPASTKLVLASDVTSLDFPNAGGYALSIALNGQVSTASLSARGVEASSSRHHGKHANGQGAEATATPSAGPSAAPAILGFFGTSFGGAASTATPASVLTTPPSTPTPVPVPKPTAPPLVNLILIPYPKYVPEAPAPAPSASSPPLRHALIRAEFESQGPLALSSLDALLFTVPSSELFAGRGFSVLVLEQGKHKRDAVLAADTGATLDASTSLIHTTGAFGPIVLQANRRYAAVLYGDDPASTPAPVITPRSVVNPLPSAPGFGATPVPGALPGITPTPTPVPTNP